MGGEGDVVVPGMLCASITECRWRYDVGMKADAGTTNVGYVNSRGQEVTESTNAKGTDYLQYIYVLRCRTCGNTCGANGSDIHARRCPFCQGGRPGLEVPR